MARKKLKGRKRAAPRGRKLTRIKGHWRSGRGKSKGRVRVKGYSTYRGPRG